MGLFVFALAISVAAVLLFVRSKQRSALAMVIGMAACWGSLGLAEFGPKTEVHVPSQEQITAMGLPPETSPEEIRQYLVRYKPLPIVHPMMIFGSSVFAVGFIVFAWGVGNKPAN